MASEAGLIVDRPVEHCEQPACHFVSLSSALSVAIKRLNFRSSVVGKTPAPLCRLPCELQLFSLFFFFFKAQLI